MPALRWRQVPDELEPSPEPLIARALLGLGGLDLGGLDAEQLIRWKGQALRSDST
jgi:hypothetical protein